MPWILNQMDQLVYEEEIAKLMISFDCHILAEISIKQIHLYAKNQLWGANYANHCFFLLGIYSCRK